MIGPVSSWHGLIAAEDPAGRTLPCHQARADCIAHDWTCPRAPREHAHV